MRHYQPAVFSCPLENNRVVFTLKSGFADGAGVHVRLPSAKPANDVAVEVFVEEEPNAAHAARSPVRRRAAILRRRSVRNGRCSAPSSRRSLLSNRSCVFR